MEVTNTDILLAKWIAGDADAAESAEAENWIAASETNQQYAARLRVIWEQSQRIGFAGTLDEKVAFQKLRQRVYAEKKTQIKENIKPNDNIIKRFSRIRLMGWMQAAAILIIVASIAFIIYRNNTLHNEGKAVKVTANYKAEIRKFNASNAVRADSLPDGTVVLLNPHTEISYPALFSPQQRNVHLSGTAFFNVAHNSARPFRITVQDLTVTVLGTSFRVSDTGATIVIAVKTGIVEVSGRNQRLKLYARDSLIVTSGSSTWTKRRDTAADQHKEKQLQPSIQPEAVAVIKTPIPEEDYQKQLATMKGILTELVKKHIVNNISSIEWAGLSDTELIVNGKKQAAAVHAMFKKEWLRVPGEGYYYGPVKMTGKGYFFAKKELK